MTAPGCCWCAEGQPLVDGVHWLVVMRKDGKPGAERTRLGECTRPPTPEATAEDVRESVHARVTACRERVEAERKKAIGEPAPPPKPFTDTAEREPGEEG